MMAGTILSCASRSALWIACEPEWLPELIAPMVADANPAKTGVYLSTRDAGTAISVGFWKRAILETVVFVSPQEFPLTLPSSVTTGVARALHLLGPNHTLIGDADASRAAWDEAVCDLARGIIERAVLIRFIAGHPGLRASAHVVVLGAGQTALEPCRLQDGDPIELACQSHAARTSACGRNSQI
jgi:hypothetical protein